MSFVATLFQPILAFLGAYKWYILIAILLYLVLTILFQHSRALITVVFGIIVLVFAITHMGDIYVSLNHLMTQVGENSQMASEQYTDYVGNNILSDEDASAGEKLQRALNYGILGRETLDEEKKLPTSDEASLGETFNYITQPSDTAASEEEQENAKPNGLLDAAGAFLTELANEARALFGF